MKKISNDEAIDYIAGYLNFTGQYEIKEIKSCIINALNMLEDEQDGILAVSDRRIIKHFIQLESGELLEISKLEFDYVDQHQNKWFYCETEKGRFHTTHKDIYRNIL